MQQTSSQGSAKTPDRDALSYPEADRSWLEDYMPPNHRLHPSSEARPFVTLTFATSLDSALSIAPGVQTALSGPQSKAMTHYIRSRHDAILVGVGTAIADDPSLNCRLEGVGGYGSEGLLGQPRPVVIDPMARWSFGEQSKVIRLAKNGKGKAPWVVSCVEPDDGRAEIVHKVGGKYIRLDRDRTNRIPWTALLSSLAAEGIRSVMIEGGGNVINSLLGPSNVGLVDSVIVTIAPVWLGADGTRVCPERELSTERGTIPVARLQKTTWTQLGNDVVLCGHIA